MKFTLVTPVLNGAKYLPRIFQSVSSQTYADWEHLIVDGGSTDGTCDLIRDHADKEPRIRLLEVPGSSIYEAIFAGFDTGSGDMLSWVNVDDSYTPWALATVRKFAGNKTAQWMTGFPGAWDSDGCLRFVRPYGLWPRSFLRHGYFHSDFLGFVQAESTFFSRDLYTQLTTGQRQSVLRAKLAGDYLLWRAFAHHAPLKVVPSVLGGFHIHGANRSLTEQEAYMAEVYGSGTWHPPAWLGRRLGKMFQMLSALTAYDAMHAADVQLQKELGLTGDAPDQ